MEWKVIKFGGADFGSDSSNNNDVFISNQDADDGTDADVLGTEKNRSFLLHRNLHS
jgi:hypothetical protein